MRILLFLLLSYSQLSLAVDTSIYYTLSTLDDKTSASILGDYTLKQKLSELSYGLVSSSTKNILTTNEISKSDFIALHSYTLHSDRSNFTGNSYSSTAHTSINEPTLLKNFLSLEEEDKEIIYILAKNNSYLATNILTKNKKFTTKLPSSSEQADFRGQIAKLKSNSMMIEAILAFSRQDLSKTQKLLTSKEISDNKSLFSVKNIYAGRVFLAKKDYKNANKYLNLAYEQNEDYSISTYYYALSRLKLGENADRYFEKMEKLSPKLESLLSRSALEVNSNSASKDLLIEAIKIKPTAANLYELAVRKGVEDEDYPKLLDKSISIAPDFYKSYMGLASWYIFKNDKKKALYTMKVAYSIEPSDIDVVLSLAEIYAKEKNTKMSLLYYQQAATINPNHPKILQRLE